MLINDVQRFFLMLTLLGLFLLGSDVYLLAYSVNNMVVEMDKLVKN
jgi:hypothetical protein